MGRIWVAARLRRRGCAVMIHRRGKGGHGMRKLFLFTTVITFVVGASVLGIDAGVSGTDSLGRQECPADTGGQFQATGATGNDFSGGCGVIRLSVPVHHEYQICETVKKGWEQIGASGFELTDPNDLLGDGT